MRVGDDPMTKKLIIENVFNRPLKNCANWKKKEKKTQ